MNSLAYVMMPLALLLPTLSDAFDGSSAPAGEAVHAAPERPRLETGLQPDRAIAPLRVLEQTRQMPPQHQVRIESRVIIRISPGSPDQRDRMLAALPRRSIETTYEEVPHGDCVAVQDIAGVQTTRDDRLLLFMRDRKILSAALERACNARAFYSGFYVERSEDGQLCVARDRLQSRTGAVCQIDTLRQLVASRD